MKKFLMMVMVFVLAQTFVFSQVIIDGVDINQLPDVEYCELLGVGKLFSAKMNISIDYGQKRKFLGKKNFYITDKDGKKVIFFSMIEGLNFMNNNGWEYVNSYVVTVDSTFGGKQNVYHYLLKRKIAPTPTPESAE
jgi:hypothetical protein